MMYMRGRSFWVKTRGSIHAFVFPPSQYSPRMVLTNSAHNSEENERGSVMDL